MPQEYYIFIIYYLMYLFHHGGSKTIKSNLSLISMFFTSLLWKVQFGGIMNNSFSILVTTPQSELLAPLKVLNSTCLVFSKNFETNSVVVVSLSLTLEAMSLM